LDAFDARLSAGLTDVQPNLVTEQEPVSRCASVSDLATVSAPPLDLTHCTPRQLALENDSALRACQACTFSAKRSVEPRTADRASPLQPRNKLHRYSTKENGPVQPARFCF
jgi:hypothetical protein